MFAVNLRFYKKMKNVMITTMVIVSLFSGLTACSDTELKEIPDSSSTEVEMKKYTNSIGMSFIEIPAGSFEMGADDADAFQCERPQHKVTISNSFYIGVYEVTQDEWEKVMGFNPYDLDRSNPYYNLPGMAERITHPNHPATVSWEDAQDFIAKLNHLEGHNRYRLPTEAEWEYAARAGSMTAYCFGDNVSGLKDYAWYGEDFETGGTHPVGKKEANAWGLHDIHGNVWEWVHDWYSETYYVNNPEVDPQGPESGTHHSVRGGSWHSSATSWRSSYRKPYKPDYRGISIGFRVVMTDMD